MKSKISVIIPAYNEEATIAACLSSLGGQNYPDYEIIVVDDGSTDSTFQVASKSKIKNLKIKVLRQRHKGPGAARNLGAKEAKGEILVFVDSDMTFAPKFLRNLVKPIISGKAKGTFSKDEYVSNWDNIWARCWNINQNWAERRRHPRVYPDTQKVFRAILKKEFDKVGGFTPGGYTDDYSLWEKLRYEAVNASGAVFYHENPSTLAEVFKQAKWSGKRKYKLGFFGDIVALIRASFPVSFIVGLIKSIFKKEPGFLIFKIVYDFGIFVGILEAMITKKLTK